MKLRSILALAVCIFAQAAFAAEAPALPTNFCSYGCSDAQKTIWAAFEKGTAFDSSALPALFSGECYHLSSSFDPAKMQFGVLGFDHSPTDSANFFQGGQFYYFYNSDPTVGMTLDDARAQGFFKYADNSKVLFQKDYATVDYTVDPMVPWTYWIRTDATNKNEILVVAQWDMTYRLFCRLDRH